MVNCPTEDTIQRHIQGRLDRAATAALAEHLRRCASCCALVALLDQDAHGSTSKEAAASVPGDAPRDRLAGAQFLDEYRIVRILGSGAMGLVYLAHDTVLDRPVAIKFIAAPTPDLQDRERFLIEARAIARLTHPNVIGVYRVGVHREVPYLVSEYVRGQPLDVLPLPLPGEQVLRVALGLSRGLAAAHRHGVLHRDIKPANVILTKDGECKLLDFGLAKLVGEGADLVSGVLAAAGQDVAVTQAGALVGTPCYMAPEVFAGTSATPRSDVFSLGALLFELATGRRFYQVRSLRELTAAHEKEAPALTELAPALAPALAAIITRCLRRDSDARYASAVEVCGALELLSQPGQGVTPSGNPYRGLRAFEAEHRALFFGRGRETRAVLERLRGDPLVLVTGDSGVGKSSLCRAGVLPALRAGALGDERRWSVMMHVPGCRPLGGLAAELAKRLGQDEESFLAELCSQPALAARRVVRHLGEREGLLIFLDHAEELITQADPQEAAQCAEALRQLAERLPGVRVLLAARSDFLPRLAELPLLEAHFPQALYILLPLAAVNLREIITEPARLTGAGFESDAVVEDLVVGAARTAGGLPLLQFALAELWEARELTLGDQLCPGGMITAKALQRIGGVSGALARHADGVLQGLPLAQRVGARRILLRLVSPGGTRVRRTLEELCGDDLTARAALATLVSGRLLCATQGEGGMSYEVAHEALSTGWGTLRAWIDESAGALAAWRRLGDAAAEWERLGRAPELLYTTRQCMEVAAIDAGSLSSGERGFLAASRQHRRRRRWMRTGLVLLAPLLLGLSYGTALLLERRDGARLVVQRLTLAREGLTDGRAQSRAAAERRRVALARFDAPGESLDVGLRAAEDEWARVLQHERAAESAYVHAGQALEALAVRSGSLAAVRQLLSDVLVERIRQAGRLHHQEQQQELWQRLALFDEGSERRRMLTAPARLTLVSKPTGALVGAARYLESEGIHRLAPAASLGVTPLRDLALDPGSYLLTLSLPDRPAVRAAILLEPDERLQVSALLPLRVPMGMVYIPAGCFLFGSAEDDAFRHSFLKTSPLHRICTAGFLIARHEVTFADWLHYLRALPTAERSLRIPRCPQSEGREMLRLLELSDGAWELRFQPGSRVYSTRSGQPIHYEGRNHNAIQDWLRFPVSCISFGDAQAYVDWLSRTGQLPGARLCDEHEWERAARGADGRLFPHGDNLAPDDANYDETYGRSALGYGPDQVGLHPASESPFGLSDMAGNAFEWTRSMRTVTEVVSRGGSWYYGKLTNRSANRDVSEPTLRHISIGLRVCATSQEEDKGGR